MAQLVGASIINCVIHGGATTSTRLGNLIAKAARVFGKSLQNLRFIIEGHHKSFVVATAQHAEQKIRRGVLLKLQAIANAIGGIQKHSDAQRKIGLFAEITDLLRDIIIKNLEIVLVQFWNKFVTAIEHRKQNVHKIDPGANRLPAILHGFLRLRRRWSGSLPGGGLWLLRMAGNVREEDTGQQN